MNFLEAITELQKPENIETKCIRPVAWGDCYEHHVIVSAGDGLRLCYDSGDRDWHKCDPYFIQSRIDILTGEWVVSTIPDIPALPENDYEEN